jgi:hypothetical protein
MPEHDNDKLDNFFRKAAERPDLAFNEEDWKKLEARLDAEERTPAFVQRSGVRIIAAVVIGALLFFSGALWMHFQYAGSQLPSTDPENEEVRQSGEESFIHPQRREGKVSSKDNLLAERSNTEQVQAQQSTAYANPRTEEQKNRPAGQPSLDASHVNSSSFKATPTRAFEEENQTGEILENKSSTLNFMTRKERQPAGMAALSNDKIFRELIHQPARGVATRINQKAVIELPGAEEEDKRTSQPVIEEEKASDRKKGKEALRLSLLLSFAPDFSSTSWSRYSTPGKAFGAMVHYHVRNSWSLSVGAIKNNKRYTGEGDDYQPPKGYWKYYTNGIIPSSIEGACDVIEFPVMIQYTISSNDKNRWLAGAGTSSYYMLNESYRYTFEEPNPGAKEGWASKNSSRFLFNMINFTVGFERSVLPGLMMGIEPYVKIPLEEIGWTNLKLFSSGASVTVRYKVLGKGRPPIQSRSRGPD